MRLTVYAQGRIENTEDMEVLAADLENVVTLVRQGFTTDPSGGVTFFIDEDEERKEDERPELEIDLSGPAGNIFVVVARACKLLDEEQGLELRKQVREQHSY